MKQQLFTMACALILQTGANAQTLTLVTGKRLYDHHSSTLSGSYYGYYNVNSQSGYDFVNHVNVPSGSAALASDRDMVEHNGPFGNTATTSSFGFGFTDSVSNIGSFNYAGNNLTRFYLNSSVSFTALNTVSDLVNAYNPAQARALDAQVVAGNVYIINVRNTNLYAAMLIKNVSNLSQSQLVALINQQPVTADVYFEFDYKYGTLVATGIDRSQGEPLSSSFNCYPNPVSHELFISGGSSLKNYRVLSITGAVAAEGSTPALAGQFIDVSRFDKGIYFLELWDDEGEFQRARFVKE